LLLNLIIEINNILIKLNIMKTKNLFILTLIALLSCIANSLFSQNTWKEYKEYASVIKPVTNSATWSDTNKIKLYNNCIIALHLSGFELDPQKTEAGKTSSLIVTNALDLQIPFGKGERGTFSLSILVYKNAENNVTINIQVNGAKCKSNVRSATQTEEGWLNNKISEDVDNLMSQLETVQGKPISTKKATINIEK
jgi:hypothetical protein